MAFRGVIEDAPSFGTQLARGLGQGLSAGISQTSSLMGQMAAEKYKQKKALELLESVKSGRLGGGSMSESDPRSLNSDQQTLEQNPYFEEADIRQTLGLPYASSIEQGKLLEKRKMAQEERDFLPKKEYIQHAAKQNSEFLDKVDQMRSDMPNTKFALAMIEDALGDADKWAAFKDSLAEKTGFAGFRSAAGAELDSAIKNYFLGDLSSIKGGRPNVFIEKQLRDAYQKAGLDPISNQKITLGMKMKEQINELLVDESGKLYQKYIDEKGYLPPNFQEIVRKSVSKKAGQIEKQSIDTLHKLSRVEKHRDKILRVYVNPGEVLMMNPEGEAVAIPSKQEAEARAQGYIPLGKKK